MSEQLFILCQDDLGNYEIRYNDKVFHFLWEVAPILNEQQATISRMEEENEQLHHELEQIKEYLQIKIDECKNPKKMKEIVFGVEQAVGYEKALLQFQKGLKRRLNDE